MNTSPMVHSTPLHVRTRRPRAQFDQKRPLRASERGLAVLHTLGWLVAMGGTSAATWLATDYRSEAPLITNFDEFFAIFVILIGCVILPGILLGTHTPKKK